MSSKNPTWYEARRVDFLKDDRIEHLYKTIRDDIDNKETQPHTVLDFLTLVTWYIEIIKQYNADDIGTSTSMLVQNRDEQFHTNERLRLELGKEMQKYATIEQRKKSNVYFQQAAMKRFYENELQRIMTFMTMANHRLVSTRRHMLRMMRAIYNHVTSDRLGLSVERFRLRDEHSRRATPSAEYTAIETPHIFDIIDNAHKLLNIGFGSPSTDDAAFTTPSHVYTPRTSSNSASVIRSGYATPMAPSASSRVRPLFQTPRATQPQQFVAQFPSMLPATTPTSVVRHEFAPYSIVPPHNVHTIGEETLTRDDALLIQFLQNTYVSIQKDIQLRMTSRSTSTIQGRVAFMQKLNENIQRMMDAQTNVDKRVILETFQSDFVSFLYNVFIKTDLYALDPKTNPSPAQTAFANLFQNDIKNYHEWYDTFFKKYVVVLSWLRHYSATPENARVFSIQKDVHALSDTLNQNKQVYLFSKDLMIKEQKTFRNQLESIHSMLDDVLESTRAETLSIVERGESLDDVSHEKSWALSHYVDALREETGEDESIDMSAFRDAVESVVNELVPLCDGVIKTNTSEDTDEYTRNAATTFLKVSKLIRTENVKQEFFIAFHGIEALLRTTDVMDQDVTNDFTKARNDLRQWCEVWIKEHESLVHAKTTNDEAQRARDEFERLWD
jgi:hypothetical protein